MFYKGWRIYYSPIGSQNWEADCHGVTIRANSKELLISMIDNRRNDGEKPK